MAKVGEGVEARAELVSYTDLPRPSDRNWSFILIKLVESGHELFDPVIVRIIT